MDQPDKMHKLPVLRVEAIPFWQNGHCSIHFMFSLMQVPAIEYLEKSIFKQYQKYAEQFVKRRQQDIKDEAADALKSKSDEQDI